VLVNLAAHGLDHLVDVSMLPATRFAHDGVAGDAHVTAAFIVTLTA
jgi:hypothetical protein